MKVSMKLLLIGIVLVSASCSNVAKAVDAFIAPPPEETVVEGLNVSYEPEFFSPDGDGENDELSVTLTAPSNTASWTFDILQPETSPRSGQVFKHFEGTGVPSDKIVWDGRSDPFEVQRRSQTGGEPQTVQRTMTVESATNYPYTFTVTDNAGTVSDPLKGIIQVDILVRPTDDGRFQIRVPSIIFRSGAADFKDLPERTVTNNERVLSRIAAALNRFAEYKVSIEGHANPENAPGTKKRADEEKKESAKGSISEKRAQAILDKLVEDGVDKARMTALGWGVSKPVAEFEDTDNAWRNRRVEFFLSKK